MTFVLLLCYLAIIYLRPAEWIPLFAGWQLMDITMLGTVFFLFLVLALTKGSSLVRIPHNRLMMGLFIVIMLSQAAHGYVGGAIHAATTFLVNMITYFLIVNIVNTQRKFHVALWALVILTSLLAWQGHVQATTGIGWAGQGTVEDGRITWIGIFNDPNDLALAFVIVVPLLLALIFGPSFIGYKWLPMALIGLLVYGIYLTNSRGGLLALMAAVGYFFIRRSKHRLLGGVMGGAVALLVFLFGPSRLGMISAEEDSAAGRLDAWYYGFQLLKGSPLFGAGHNMFTDDYPMTAHNSFVLAFAELGLVGFFCWVGLLYVTFKGLGLVEKHLRLWPYAIGLEAGLVGFCAAAFFLSRTYILIPYLLVALSAALSNVARLQMPEFVVRLNRLDVRNIALACLAILVLLQVAMKTWL